ncbi:MAG: hypothetical protein MRZ79_23080 [Bacteroidia bacterium]|nr:hypothetical protein [Bacteroidia bacterium]
MRRTYTTCKCAKKGPGKRISSLFPTVGGFILAILPKCPFCVLAYTSALSLCGSTQLHYPVWASWISLSFALLTLFFVLYNYKGTKTILSASIVSIGCLLIVWAELNTGSLYDYYAGTSLVLLGVWINGSLFHFLKKGMAFFHKSLGIKKIIRPLEPGDT